MSRKRKLKSPWLLVLLSLFGILQRKYIIKLLLLYMYGYCIRQLCFGIYRGKCINANQVAKYMRITLSFVICQQIIYNVIW